MRHYRLFVLMICLLLTVSCGNEQSGEVETGADETQTADTVLNDQEQIKAMLAELIDRVKEGDKNVLYEFEFDYFKDSVSLSEYMEIRRVIEYKYDTLSGIEVDSITLMGDSALVVARVTYKSDVQGTIERAYPLKVYHYHGRWVRPYLSRYNEELEYQERIKAYKEAIGEE